MQEKGRHRNDRYLNNGVEYNEKRERKRKARDERKARKAKESRSEENKTMASAVGMSSGSLKSGDDIS